MVDYGRPKTTSCQPKWWMMTETARSTGGETLQLPFSLVQARVPCLPFLSLVVFQPFHDHHIIPLCLPTCMGREPTAAVVAAVLLLLVSPAAEGGAQTVCVSVGVGCARPLFDKPFPPSKPVRSERKKVPLPAPSISLTQFVACTSISAPAPAPTLSSTIPPPPIRGPSSASSD